MSKQPLIDSSDPFVKFYLDFSESFLTHLENLECVFIQLKPSLSQEQFQKMESEFLNLRLLILNFVLMFPMHLISKFSAAEHVKNVD